MFNTIFKIVYFVELLIATIIRKYYTARYRNLNLVVDNKTTLDIIFLALNGIGMIVPIVYVLSSVLDFANYNLPAWMGWIGAVLFGYAIWLLWRSHADLGKNWTPILAIRQEHRLITNGIFKYIRHPMYAAHILWAIAQILILHNWIAGYSFVIFVVPHYLSRVKNEEKMMLEQFEEEYKIYMQRTGRVFPRLLR